MVTKVNAHAASEELAEAGGRTTYLPLEPRLADGVGVLDAPGDALALR